MRLSLEPQVTTFPAVANNGFETGSTDVSDPDVFLRQGIAAAQNGDRENARLLLTLAADGDPTSEEARMWLASISDYPEETLALLGRVLEINPLNELAAEWQVRTKSVLANKFVQQAVEATEQGMPTVATELLDRALVHDSDCEMAWFWKASLVTGDVERLEYLARVLQINPANAEAEAAIDKIHAARKQATFAGAKSAAVGGDREKAFDLVDEFLRAVPDNAEAWILRSHLATELQDKLESLGRALDIEPENAGARASYDFLTATLTPADPDPMPVDAERVEASSLEFETETSVGEAAYSFNVLELIDDTEEPNPLTRSEITETPAISCCPFCTTNNEMLALKCSGCNAVLTVSELDMLLNSASCDSQSIRDAVVKMEAEWNLREFDEIEMTTLALGHFNLQDSDQGLKYLREASRLNPNNVMLASQANAIAIRLEETRRQNDAPSSVPTGKSILVVDDSSTVRKLIAGKLEKSGHTVICAVDGVEALENIGHGLPDLVLLDITMPRMDGYEVCRQIRSDPAAANLPIIMISGKDGFFDKVRGRMAGTTAYITKPFGPETLMKALDAYLIPDSEV